MERKIDIMEKGKWKRANGRKCDGSISVTFTFFHLPFTIICCYFAFAARIAK